MLMRCSGTQKCYSHCDPVILYDANQINKKGNDKALGSVEEGGGMLAHNLEEIKLQDFSKEKSWNAVLLSHGSTQTKPLQTLSASPNSSGRYSQASSNKQKD